jgi:hypothetical protein
LPPRGASQRRSHSLDLLSGFLTGYWSEYTMVRRELFHLDTLYSTTAVPLMEDSHNRECECDDLRERQSDLFSVVTRRIEYSPTADSITSPSHSSALRPSPSVPLHPNFQYQKGTETVWFGPGLLTTHFLKWRR